MRILEVRKELEKLGKSVNAELYSYSDEPIDGNEIKSSWDVRKEHYKEKFEGSILRLIMLYSEEISTLKAEYNNIGVESKIYFGLGEEDKEDHSSDCEVETITFNKIGYDRFRVLVKQRDGLLY